MGMILCKKHGPGGFYEICTHLFEDFKKGIYSPYQNIPGIYNLTKVCHACATSINLAEIDDLKTITEEDLVQMPEEDALEVFNRFSEKYDQIDRKAICQHCYTELQIAHNRKLGLSDPFFVYENTLLYKDNAQIKQLETYLKAHFTFPKFQDPFFHNDQPDQDAMTILWGNIYEPLSIDLYYVIDGGAATTDYSTH